MDSIVIENIKEEDLDEIIQIGHSTPELQVENQVPAYYTKRELRAFIKSPHDIYLAARVNGQLAGYRLATFNSFLKEAYLIDMVVKPEFRGRGIASLLYNKTFELLRKKKCGWAWALVKEDNEKMKEILQKKGFKKGNKFYFFYKVEPF
jgi:ribosomal protein S18 acetylase RimI-like enzyme